MLEKTMRWEKWKKDKEFSRPSVEFWPMWKRNSGALMVAGYRLERDATGKWMVIRPRGVTLELDKERMVMSRAESPDPNLPMPTVAAGLELFDFQKAGVQYALRAEGNVLFGDDMGLGKTAQAIAVANSLRPESILVVSTNSTKLNWRKEILRWATFECDIHIVQGTRGWPARELVASTGKGRCQVVIINYDVLASHAEAMRLRKWDLGILDEIHKIKNPDTQRCKALLGGSRGKPVAARKWLALSGTPIPNRPIELYPVLRLLDRARWPDKWAFGNRYCGGQQSNFRGASHLPELGAIMRSTVMVRRTKAQVLTQLPAKQRTVVELPSSAALRKKLDLLLNEVTLTDEASQEIRDRKEAAKARAAIQSMEDQAEGLAESPAIAFDRMSAYRAACAEAKAPMALDFIRDMLEENEGRKIVVFAHHLTLLNELVKGLKDHGVVTIHGGVAAAKRQGIVDRFQDDPGTRVFVGGLSACQEGLTLTAASTVVFTEFDWVPASVSQAEDRCHRIGQTEQVEVFHLVMEGSLDATMVRTVIAKQKVLDRVMDDKGVTAIRLTEQRSNPRTVNLECPPPHVQEILRDSLDGLVKLSDDDFRDGVGLSRHDNGLVRYLLAHDPWDNGRAIHALRLCIRYRRQLFGIQLDATDSTKWQELG